MLIAAIGLALLAVPFGTTSGPPAPASDQVIASLEAPGLGPGERVATVLGAIAQAEGTTLPQMGPCPSLADALALHTQRLDLPRVDPPGDLPPDLADALACLLDGVHASNLALDATAGALPEGLAWELVTGQRTMPAATELTGVDHGANLEAAIHLAHRVQAATDLLEGLQDERASLPPVDLAPLLRFEPTGSTLYTANYAVQVDLSGDDVYDNHAGGVFAAVGNGIYEVEDGSAWRETTVAGRQVSVGGDTQDASAVLSSSIVLDTGGDDLYGLEHPPRLDDARHGCGGEPLVPRVGTQGGGIVGTGMLFDLEGHNTLIGRTQTQGAGHIAGIGVLYLGPGDEHLEAVRSAQGQGLLGGIGLLLDEGGRSTYALSMPVDGVWNGDLTICDDGMRYAQGSSFDRRAGPLLHSVGLLADLGGSDAYQAGTLAQGFGQGIGLGMLYDASGSDRYTAEDQAQGYAQGRSRDLNPNAPWGSGQAILLDRQGDDAYTLAGRGQGYALGHPTEDPPPPEVNPLLLWSTDRDEALAALVDEAGQDTYIGPLDRANGQVATEGLLGVFLDAG